MAKQSRLPQEIEPGVFDVDPLTGELSDVGKQSLAAQVQATSASFLPVNQEEFAQRTGTPSPSDPTGIVARTKSVNEQIIRETVRIFGSNYTPNQLNIVATNLGLAGPGSEAIIQGTSRLPNTQLSTFLGSEGLLFEEQFNQLLAKDSSLWTDVDWEIIMRVTNSPPELIDFIRRSVV